MSEKEVKIEKCNVLERNRQYLNVADRNGGEILKKDDTPEPYFTMIDRRESILTFLEIYSTILSVTFKNYR